MCRENCEFLSVRNVDFLTIVEDIKKHEDKIKEEFVQNVFGGELSPDTITRIAQNLRVTFKYPENTVIFTEGSQPDYVYFIASGEVILAKQIIVPPTLEGDPRPTLVDDVLQYSNNRYYCEKQYQEILMSLKKQNQLTLVPNLHKFTKENSKIAKLRNLLKSKRVPSETSPEILQEYTPKAIMTTRPKSRMTDKNIEKVKLPDQVYELKKTRRRRALYMAKLKKSPLIIECNKRGYFPYICFEPEEATICEQEDFATIKCQRTGVLKNIITRKCQKYDYFGENGYLMGSTAGKSTTQRVHSAIAVSSVSVYAIAMSTFTGLLSSEDMAT